MLLTIRMVIKMVVMIRIIYAMLLIVLIFGCNSDHSSENMEDTSTLFTEIFTTESGIDFNNQIIETPDVNYYKYVYLYNGGGVGIGDINNDNLPDIYFTSTQGSDQLFLNRGDFHFENISTTSGIDHFGGQKTGVTMIIECGIQNRWRVARAALVVDTFGCF